MCWVKDEVKTVHLGDSRLDERMEKILRDLGGKRLTASRKQWAAGQKQ